MSTKNFLRMATKLWLSYDDWQDHLTREQTRCAKGSESFDPGVLALTKGNIGQKGCVDWQNWFENDHATAEGAQQIPRVLNACSIGVPFPEKQVYWPSKQRPHELNFFDLPTALRLQIYELASANDPQYFGPGAKRHIYCAHYEPSRPKCYNCWRRQGLDRLTVFSTVCRQFATEAREIWFGMWLYWIGTDRLPISNVSSRKARGADFPELKRYLRVGGPAVRSERNIRISGGCVSPADIPLPATIERALEGCEDMHPDLKLEIVFSHCNRCSKCARGCSGRVLCKNIDGKLVVQEHRTGDLGEISWNFQDGRIWPGILD